MRRLAAFALLACAAFADDARFPPGRTEAEVEGLQTTVIVPEEPGADGKHSLVFALHGAGSNGSSMASLFVDWPDRGFVVCAPSARGQVWTAADLKAARAVAALLREELPIHPDRIHVVGYSNGGWNLAPLAFDDDLRPRTACWVGAGFRGGSVPKWAKKRLGVLALAGADDPNAGAARQTVPLLEKKVQSAEARLQPSLGHRWPFDLMPYYRWWLAVHEDRFTPGEDENFVWGEFVSDAVEELEDEKRGGIFCYVWSAGDKDKPEAKRLQNEVLRDPRVREAGAALKAVKMELEIIPKEWGVGETPAILLFDRKGELKKVLTGKFKARSLAAALRKTAR